MARRSGHLPHIYARGDAGRGVHRGHSMNTRHIGSDSVLAPSFATSATTPLGLFSIPKRAPKVARSSQPWAAGHNPFGIVGTGLTSAWKHVRTLGSEHSSSPCHV